jgi:hypothetical protein
LWLVLMALLLVWKGALYSEAVQARQLLGMQAPAAANIWWLGGGCVIALVLVSYVFSLFWKRRSVRGRG